MRNLEFVVPFRKKESLRLYWKLIFSVQLSALNKLTVRVQPNTNENPEKITALRLNRFSIIAG
jgi:hypothetical protein